MKKCLLLELELLFSPRSASDAWPTSPAAGVSPVKALANGAGAIYQTLGGIWQSGRQLLGGTPPGPAKGPAAGEADIADDFGPPLEPPEPPPRSSFPRTTPPRSRTSFMTEFI